MSSASHATLGRTDPLVKRPLALYTAAGGRRWEGMDTAFTPAEANLRERVTNEIRLGIVSGEIGPGAMLSAPALSKTLGISTTPIREALLQLSSDGLLQARRNRGFCVVGPTLEELRNVLEVRVQLETFALIKLAETGLRDVRELESQARQIAEAVEAGDVMRYLAADRAFHLELLTRAGNDVLTGTVMRLRDTMRLYGIRSRAGLARQRASVPEHYEIIEALGCQDRKDLTALMREHILSWESVFTEAIRACGPSPGPLATSPGRSARP